MNQETRELRAFMILLTDNPRDVEMRKVFADWLDEHDEPVLADEQRQFSVEKYDARERMKKAAEEHMSYHPPDERYNRLLEEAKEGKICFFGSSGWGTSDEYPEFWDDVELLTDTKLDEEHRSSATFRCAC